MAKGALGAFCINSKNDKPGSVSLRYQSIPVIYLAPTSQLESKQPTHYENASSILLSLKKTS